MKKNLRLSTLSYTLFVSLAAIDKGHVDKFSFQDFYRGLDAGTLFEDIQQRIGSDIDLSMITGQEDQKALLIEVLEATRAALEGRERRKTGIESSGLVLLCAYLTELIQHYAWDTMHDRPAMDKQNY